MLIPKEDINTIFKKAEARYDSDPDPKKKVISIQYSLASQIIINCLGDEFINFIPKMIPEAVHDKVKSREDSRIIESDGFVKITQTFSGSHIPSGLGRIIFFAHCLLDLEKSIVINFRKIKDEIKEYIDQGIFEKVYYVIIIASHLARRGVAVEFIKEGRKFKTPDLLLKNDQLALLAECKCNTFADLDKVNDKILRTKRIFDRFDDGCKQIQEYGEKFDKFGLVYIQYFNNTYLEFDKEYIRQSIISIANNFPRVMGGSFTYETYDIKKVSNDLKLHGFIKPDWLSKLSKNFIRDLMFQDPWPLSSLEKRILEK